MTGGPRAVVLRALGLGDLCTAVPALRALRRAAPDHRVVLCAPRPLAPLAGRFGVADELVPTGGLGPPLPARLAGADLAVNLHGRGPESHRLLEAVTASRLVAFGVDGCPAWRDDEHEVDRWCRLVGWALEVAADPTDLRLEQVGLDPDPSLVVVHPGAAAPARRWPVARFGAVVAGLRRRGLAVVVTGDARERTLAAAVLAEAGCTDDPGCRVAAGTTDLLALAGLVERAAVVLSGDTGVAHLATALGRPSVVLFGPTSPDRWGPPATGDHTVLWAGRTGDPHGSVPDPGLLEITVPEVLAALDQRLG